MIIIYASSVFTYPFLEFPLSFSYVLDIAFLARNTIVYIGGFTGGNSIDGNSCFSRDYKRKKNVDLSIFGSDPPTHPPNMDKNKKDMLFFWAF